MATALDHDAIGIVVYLDPAQTDVKPEIITAKELAALKNELAFASLSKNFVIIRFLLNLPFKQIWGNNWKMCRSWLYPQRMLN